jgi:hypothetical protein
MGDEHDALEVAIQVPTEAEAGMIVQFLADREIDARAVGGFTSGFRAEAPGWCSVLVNRGNLDRAKRALAEVRQE